MQQLLTEFIFAQQIPYAQTIHFARGVWRKQSEKTLGMSPESRARTNTTRGYPRLENGSSSYGTGDMTPETRDAVMSMRSDWKFYATVSFCHTFRAVLKLPKFTADQLGACDACVN